MPKGKYFYIRSNMNGMVLDIQGCNADPGTSVFMWDKKDEDDADNQLFFLDPIYGVIRTKLSDNMVLDFDDGENALIINEFEEGKESQLWSMAGDRIMNGADNDSVLDIARNENECGARVCRWNWKGSDNQLWSCDHVKAKYFFIMSEMNGKVIDIPGADSSSGVKVVMYDQGEGQDHQLWYEDRAGNIRSKLNDYCLDASKGKVIRMQPSDPDNSNMTWSVCGNRIVNVGERDKVLGIKKAKDRNGAKLWRIHDDGEDHQKWVMENV